MVWPFSIFHEHFCSCVFQKRVYRELCCTANLEKNSYRFHMLIKTMGSKKHYLCQSSWKDILSTVFKGRRNGRKKLLICVMWFMAESVTKPQKLIKAYIQWRLAVEKFWQSTSERMRSLWEDNRLSKGTQQAKM